MAEGEELSFEQAGGSTPPPGLGVPEFGSAATETPPVKPEVVQGYDPYAPTPQPPPARRRRGLTISRIILIAFLLLAALGWVVAQVRHAHATPADKQACASTLAAVSNPSGNTLGAMLHDVDFASDKTLLGAAGDITLHIQQQNVQALDNDLNKVIHRCNQLSDSFKTGFQQFCDSHPGYCRQSFHIGPF